MKNRGEVRAIRERLADPRALAAILGLRHVGRHGTGIIAACPIHGNKSPSLSLARRRDGTIWAHCFGCPFAGDVLSLIAALRGYDIERDFRAVVAEAASLASMPVPELPAYRDAPTLPDATFDAFARHLLELAPLRGDVARYVDGRGIGREARADGWGALPPYRAQGGLVRALLDAHGPDVLDGSGLCVLPDDGPWRLARPGARVLIPWRGADGRILSLQRRRLDDGEPRYVAPRGRPLSRPYGLHALAGVGPVVYVEGAVDALALRRILARSRRPADVLALPGIEAWSAAWAEHARVRDAYVALDDDEPGERAAVVLARDLTAAGALTVARWRPPAHDWAETLAKGRRT